MSVQAFSHDASRYSGVTRSLHPTQKPVSLFEWVIATYTNEGDTVLDPCMGSGVTGIACARLGRNFIGIEKDAEYFRIGTDRVNAERAKLGLSQAVVNIRDTSNENGSPSSTPSATVKRDLGPAA